jgi:K+:H+ antiporter
MYLLAAASLEPSDITRLMLALAVLLGAARLLGETARQFKQPAVLGEILAGVLLGPTVLGFVSPELLEWLFPISTTEPARIALDGFVVIAATLLLLVVGLEVDLSTVRRQGKATAFVSMLGVAFPFILGAGLAFGIPEVLGAGERGLAAPLPFAIFVGIALSITALPVIAKILMDLNLAKSDLGMLIISSAMLNDLVGWIGFAVVLALLPSETGSSQGTSVFATIAMTLAFLAVMVTLGRWLCHKALPYIQSRWSWPGGVLGFVSVVALACAAFTEYLGIHSIFGAFIAGVAIGDSPRLREKTRETIHQFVTNFFAPIFFASIGLRINFVSSFEPVAVVIVLAVAFVGKAGGCYLGATLAGMSKRESWATAFGMTCQGAVGIILGQLAYSAGLINDGLLVAVVIMALATSLFSGPAMQAVLKTKTRIRLADILSDKHILIQMQATAPTDAITELADRGAELTGLSAETIARSALRREAAMSTGMPLGLAVPHARLDGLSKPCMIVGRSVVGVDFNAMDGKPAHLICLLLTPTDNPDAQIELLALFARTFQNATLRQHIMAVESTTEFRAELNLADDAGSGDNPEASHPPTQA